MSIFFQIHKFFRCCLHCGSNETRDSLFCPICEADLWGRHQGLQPFQIFDSDVHGLALFDWHPDSDRKVSKLMMTLKGGKLREAYLSYAKVFVSHLPHLALPLNTVLVPCPNRENRLHSQQWAEALSEILKVPVMNKLSKSSGFDSQKLKSRRERATVSMETTENLSRYYVIFIDDIVTTGATTLSAYRALGSPKSFEVWCLAHRRQLAALPNF